VNFNALESYLTKYQNPKEADAMTQIQTNIDETQIQTDIDETKINIDIDEVIINAHNAITDISQEEEALKARCEKLNTQSKVFDKTSRKPKKCCNLL
jgi:synaptobrevin family protein YKT6